MASARAAAAAAMVSGMAVATQLVDIGAAAAASASASSATKPDSSFVPVDLSKMDFSHHLLHAALSGDDKLENYELFHDKANRKLNAHARLGEKACGHPRIVHGGALASLLDDAFGSLFFASRVGNGFTANLTVDYRAPVAAGADIIVQTAIDRIEGRKVFLTGRIIDAKTSVVYTEGKALFIVKAVPSSEALVSAVAASVEGSASSPAAADRDGEVLK